MYLESELNASFAESSVAPLWV